MKQPSSKNIYERLSLWQRLCALIVSGAAVIGITCGALNASYAGYVKPKVDSQIHEHVDPINETLEFICFLMQEALPDSAVDHATKRFIASKRARGLVK
jgi:hypothetical protein